MSVQRIGSSVAPTPSARLRLRPIDGRSVVIRDGLLADRQRVNREVTLLRGAEELERAGTLDNFRIAAGRARGERRGMVFSDSDVYKWVEALAWEIGREPSAELERLAAEAVELVAAAQQPDGYLNTWAQIVDPAWRWSDLAMGHELYCAGHLFQAGVALARTTGDASLLAVARRFADLIDDVFRGGDQAGTDGHPEIEVALVELYRETGEPRYLELAEVLTAAAVPVSPRGISSTFATTRTPSPSAPPARWAAMPFGRSTSPPASSTSTPRPATRLCSPRCWGSGTTWRRRRPT